MEIKLVGWTTGYDNFPDAQTFIGSAEKWHFNFLAEKAIKEDIMKNKWLFCGDWHQNGKCGMPVISVDSCIGQYMMAWRAWGALMADCWNNIEQTLKYDYMDFYMTCLSDKETRHSEEECKL